MRNAKAILMNPYVLGAQGFIAGAFLLWAEPSFVEPAQAAPAPPAAVRIVPPVS